MNDSLIDAICAAEVKRRNSERRIPMTPEANFRRGVEAAIRAFAQDMADAKRFQALADMDTDEDMPDRLYSAWCAGPEEFRKEIDAHMRGERQHSGRLPPESGQV